MTSKYSGEPGALPPELQSKPEQKKSKEEIRDIHGRLETLIRTISGRPDLHVTTEMDPLSAMEMMSRGMTPENSWFYRRDVDPKTKKIMKEYIRIPETIIAASENFAKGAAAHEAGHVLITRFGDFIPDEVAQELGFVSLMSSMEERPTDQVIRDRFPGAGLWVDEMRRALGEEGEANMAGKLVHELPEFLQFGNLLVFEPHAPGLLAQASERVRKLYEKLRVDIERVEKMLPPAGATEAQVLEENKKRYRLVYRKMLPKVKELLKEDMKKEEARKLAEKAAQSNDPNELDELFKALSEEIQKHLEAAIDEYTEAAKKAEEENAKNPGAKPKPVKIKMSKELLEALIEYVMALPPEERLKLRQAAEKELKREEDQFVQAMGPAIGDLGMETHAEYDERMAHEAMEAHEAAEQEQIDRELKRVAAMEKARRETRSEYDKAYEEVRAMDDELYQRLEEIFTPNIKRNVRLRSSGTRLNLPAVYKWEASRSAGAAGVDFKLYEQRDVPEKPDFGFELLVDLSGSMSEDGKIQETFKAVVLLAEVLNRLGVRSQILGFQDKVLTFKNFDEELTDEVRKKMSGMMLETIARNPDGNNHPTNYDGPCVAEASQLLDSEITKEKFLLVFSDGLPVGKDFESGEVQLRGAVRKILADTNQKLIGLGLGPDTEHVKKYYPTSLPSLSVKDLPETLSALLEDMITNPQKYAK